MKNTLYAIMLATTMPFVGDVSARDSSIGKGLAFSEIYREDGMDEKKLDAVVRRLSLSGSAQLDVAPDEAEVQISIVTEKKEVSLAHTLNADIAANVVSALKQRGAEVETLSYSVNKTGRYENNIYVETGYQVVNSLKVKTNKLDLVGKLIDVAIEHGANNIGTISFGISEQHAKELKYTLLAYACEDAKQKATLLANALGAQVGPALEVNVTNYDSSRHYAPAVLKAAGAETPIEPRKVTNTATINIVFELKY